MGGYTLVAVHGINAVFEVEGLPFVSDSVARLAVLWTLVVLLPLFLCQMHALVLSLAFVSDLRACPTS